MLKNTNENIDPIEDLFKRKFEEHEETPPAHVWKNISSKLDFITTPNIPFWKKPAFHLSTAVVSSIILMAYFYFKNETPEKSAPTLPTLKKEVIHTPISDSAKALEKLPVVSSTRKIKEERKPIQKTIEPNTESIPVIESNETAPEEIEVEKKEKEVEPPVKEEKTAEPEPTNLFDQLKKEQKNNAKRELFIEKKE